MLNRKGFTLIEVLVASALFLILVSGFSYLLKLAATTISSAKNFNESLYLASSKMEELRAVPFEKLSPSSFAEGSGKVMVTPVLPDLKSISIELNWNPKRQPIKMWSLRSKY